jgi:hypothetical protein
LFHRSMVLANSEMNDFSASIVEANRRNYKVVSARHVTLVTVYPEKWHTGPQGDSVCGGVSLDSVMPLLS